MPEQNSGDLQLEQALPTGPRGLIGRRDGAGRRVCWSRQPGAAEERCWARRDGRTQNVVTACFNMSEEELSLPVCNKSSQVKIKKLFSIR